jgi:hypothetical protein
MSEPLNERCAEVRDLIPELAMGVASGEERAGALAHVATCAECRALLEEATRVVDELVLLAPEQEPPAGFEARVLAALPRRLPLHRRRATWLAVAAALLAAFTGTVVTRWADSDERQIAADYRRTLQVADGSYLRAADLTTTRPGRAGVTEVGNVFAYEGKPSWVFMTVAGAPSGDYHVTLVTKDGRARSIGTCWVRGGNGSWGTAVDVPIYALDRIEMRAEDGTTLTAAFRS